MKTTEEPVIVKQSFKKSPGEVWEAITNHSIMIKWYFDNIPEFKPEVGFTTQFNVSTEERDFLHIWTITEVVPEKRIAYNWQYNGYDGSADVFFDLEEVGNETQLTVRVNVLEDFDDNIPEFTRESCLGGWTYFIHNRLKNFLEE